MNKRTADAPPMRPEGWRDAVSKSDERIGYILRNLSRQCDISLEHEEVQQVLRLNCEYDKSKKENNYYG
ncbi:hypothetical protein G7L40_02235 [Paenibacillus polymyxa]|uniref:Uncharacterized protein n=1 Tax=Paenibacillus polymyxa TaxID=1406 RepID=A0A378XWM6_PAEPO|nr:hypothetical protein [Paenibacillus polymyxa]MBE7897522.1 hypothetical protein [Paenibacillus polymyxa]MBG9766198.1 hypothetical protein [Paenibacillus polymyxa]QPK51644.1 hypothetical protein G7035_02230 [Paenibacillus polymyxa]QPK56732.1 hypothetical protein G7L40_02235 [Paenibacillus polymyxa]UOD87831.1 hypothetical protein CUU60_22580 [Paenibacillus polymyxa ATCC 842]